MSWTQRPSRSSARCSTAQWKRLRAKTLQRDEHICQLHLPGCTFDATAVDHVINYAQGGTDDMDNLQSVCGPCHSKKTAREAAAGRNKWKRQPERHPADYL